MRLLRNLLIVVAGLVVVAAIAVALLHDNTMAPIEGPFRGTGALLTFLSGGGDENTLPSLKAKEAAHAEIRFGTLPRYDEVVLLR